MAIVGKFIQHARNGISHPGFYIPVSAAMIASALVAPNEIRQLTGLDPKPETLPLIDLKDQDPVFLERTAYHEAAHTVAALALNRPYIVPDSVTIQPSHENSSWGMMELDDEKLAMAGTTEDYMSLIAIAYAGTVAESYFYGGASHVASEDVAHATTLALNMSRYNLGKYIPIDHEVLQAQYMFDDSELAARKAEITENLAIAYNGTALLVQNHAADIEMLAQALLNDPDHTLTGDEVKEILGYVEGKGLDFPLDEENPKFYVENPYFWYLVPVEEEPTPQDPPQPDIGGPALDS